MATRKPKQEWTVRLINWGEDDPTVTRPTFRTRNRLPGLWVEQLRYMGFARELKSFQDPPRQVIEIYAPRDCDSKVWADHNAGRMRSFGLDAAAAPKWDGYSIITDTGGTDRLVG